MDSKSVFSISYMDKKLGPLSSFEDRRRERESRAEAGQSRVSPFSPPGGRQGGVLSLPGQTVEQREVRAREHSVPKLGIQ